MRRISTPLHFTLKAWAAVVLLLAVVAAIAAGVTLYGHQGKRLNDETNARIDAGRVQRQQTDYELCVKIDGLESALRNVVETAFTGTVTITPAEVAQLPEATRRILEALEPVLKDSSNATEVRKSTVLAQVPATQDCGPAPPGETTTTQPPATTSTTRAAPPTTG